MEGSRGCGSVGGAEGGSSERRSVSGVRRLARASPSSDLTRIFPRSHSDHPHQEAGLVAGAITDHKSCRVMEGRLEVFRSYFRRIMPYVRPAATHDLTRRIRLGEDPTLELKRILVAGSKIASPKRDDFADEMAAMANTRGGTLVLGVADRNREIVEIPLRRLDGVETWVRKVCNDSVKPPLDAEINKLELPDTDGRLRSVIEIVVPRSLFAHESPGGYFRRIGSSKRKLPAEALARLLQERSQSRIIRFDETPIPGSAPEDLDTELVGRFLAQDVDVDETWLRKLRLVAADEDNVARVTVSGALLCCRTPTDWMPHAYVQAVSYAGERRDLHYQNDARDIGGPLDTQIFEALHFVRRNMFIRATKDAVRVDRPQFSERAVFEALANAVAHRDYSMAGARIRLHMFADRLELYVPWTLPNTLTTDSMPLRQYSRNELIVSLLARCPMPADQHLGRSRVMDRRGDGVPIILGDSSILSGRMPEYTVIDDSELRLVVSLPLPGSFVTKG